MDLDHARSGEPCPLLDGSLLVFRVESLVTGKATHIAMLINPFVTDGDALQLPWLQAALLDLEE